MTTDKRLVLRKESLADLTPGDLRLVVGARSGMSDCSLPTRDVTQGCTETVLTCHCP